ncbi:MAG: hypothetical protein P4L16_06350 [Chlamydiales bacterium]|nr:hypothetical protein [Chlamydiales bacterium]
MICLLTCLLLAATTPTVIESDLASYDGNEMTLKGNVHLEHDFGELSAGIAHITKDPFAKEFQKLHLEKNVFFSFPSGSILTCEVLDINIANGDIELKSTASSPWVCFDGVLENKAINLKSPKIDISLQKQPGTVKLQDYIEKIEAFPSVTASYQDLFQLTAGMAIYHKNSGLLTFLPQSEQEFCKVRFQETSEILSSKITINQQKHCITFEEPKGTLTSLSKDAPLSFSSKTLDWNEPKNLLTLHNDVEIQYLQSTIKNDDKVLLLLENDGKNNNLKKIESSGTTHLLHEPDQSVVCIGKVSIDHANASMCLEGDSLNQITYEDPTSTLQADRVTIDYAQTDGKTRPSKITFFGNVSSITKASAEDLENDEILRYAMADLVYYFPDKKEIVLKAFPGKKVLFFDSTKKIEISADEISVNKNSANQKEHIKTKGRVRMVFDEKETHLFKQKFALETK